MVTTSQKEKALQWREQRKAHIRGSHQLYAIEECACMGYWPAQATVNPKGILI